jgi:hypothetical protein
MRDGRRFVDLCSSNVWIQMLRECHVPGVAARTDSVTDEIAAVPGHPFRFSAGQHENGGAAAGRASKTVQLTQSLWRVSEN